MKLKYILNILSKIKLVKVYIFSVYSHCDIIAKKFKDMTTFQKQQSFATNVMLRNFNLA